MGTRIIKCSECGTINTNTDYCSFCNSLISDAKKRALKAEEVKNAQIKEVKKELENPNLAERLKKHPFLIYRIFGWILYSAILVVSAIGAGLAWFIAIVAAG